ncbi:MAG TPA: PUA domain-containing protein, partial [Gammaproteobacteria bacterium]|nr:PUA domain-containing protein [Gammaproteobacteria bacterium]
AVAALMHERKSLLPIGIIEVKGVFTEGTLLEIEDTQGHHLASGLTYYASADIKKILGKKTTEIAEILGHKYYDEVIHRNNLVLMHEKEEHE